MGPQKNKYLKILSVILFAISFSACSTEQQYLVNLSFVKNAVIDYQENGGFHKDAAETIDNAKKEFDKITPGKKSAVIFDVDETSLSNYPFNKEWDFGYVQKYWDKWVDSAKAPAIPEVFDLYKYLVNRGFKIIFLTGRKDYQYYATMGNLIKVGYEKFDTLIVKDKNYYDSLAVKFKSGKRTELTAKGYNIVGTVGDQWSDLEGPYHGIQVKIQDYQYFIK
jgi:acid phosphatase